MRGLRFSVAHACANVRTSMCIWDCEDGAYRSGILMWMGEEWNTISTGSGNGDLAFTCKVVDLAMAVRPLLVKE